MRIFDGFLFGSGLTINLLHQLQAYIPPKKHYLLNIDDFLKSFIGDKLNQREERRIYCLFYSNGSAENRKNFHRLKNTIAKYYEAHNANIEYYLGVDLFQEEKCGYSYYDVTTNFPFLYNIWHEILLEYLYYLGLDERIMTFVHNIGKYLDDKRRIFTTNFDMLAEELKPEHLHGIFVRPYRHYNDLIFRIIDDSQFLYKCIWGWNGIGKRKNFDKYKRSSGHEKFFSFDFFYSVDFHIENLLIYGLGFQKSGYMEAMADSMPKYKELSVGGIIDEHILLRLNELQNRHQLKHITFSYYSEDELKHYQELVEYFSLEQIDYVKSSEFIFSIED